MARVGHQAAGVHAGEAPALARDHRRGPVGLVAHRQERVRLLEVRGAVGEVATVRQKEVADVRAGLKLGVHAAAERTPRRVARLRGLHPVEARDLRHVALPAARNHHPAPLHEEAVADVEGRVGIRPGDEGGARRAVEVGYGDGIAAIHHVEQHAAAAPRPVDGEQDGHVTPPLDAAGGIARSQLHVGDAPVRGMERVDGEVEPALQLFVRADLTGGTPEGRAASERPPQEDLEAGDGHGTPQSAPTRRGKIWPMLPRRTASAISSMAVGSALRMMMRAPDSRATGTTPATG